LCGVYSTETTGTNGENFFFEARVFGGKLPLGEKRCCQTSNRIVLVFEMVTEVVPIRIPDAFLALAGIADGGRRILRAEGDYEKMTRWFDALCQHIGPCVSPGGAAVYAGVTRAGVYKRLRAGKLTAFCFHITQDKQTLFGGKKTLKKEPLVYIPVEECQAWRKELEGRAARIEATKVATPDDEAAFAETQGDEKDLNPGFLENDPGDKRRKGVRRPFPWEELG
jgi:hypothetical protein